MFWRTTYQGSLRAVFVWLSDTVQERDTILLEELRGDSFFRFHLPLRSPAMPNRVRGSREEATFVIRMSLERRRTPGKEWIRIFSSPEIELFEKESRIVGARPLRWGLSDVEKTSALDLARQGLERFLSGAAPFPREFFHSLDDRFIFKTDLDVALWVRGRLRGSAVVEGRHLGEGIVEAACAAARDARFKPLVREELPATRIEITVMHDLRVPLSLAERRRGAIYSDKGYLLSSRGRTGWYLPEVLNVRRFRDLDEFLGDLASEKAGLAREAHRLAETRIFEVDDFIESPERRIALSLRGPVVRRARPSLEHAALSPHLRAAGEWVLRLQEEDGNIIPVLNPLSGARAQIDWPRLAFTAWALGETGRVLREQRFSSAASRALAFLKHFLLEDVALRISSYDLSLAYSGQLARTLGDAKLAEQFAAALKDRAPSVPFDPITFLQAASFLAECAQDNKELLPLAERFAAAAQQAFERGTERGEHLSLAVWAEAANTFEKLFAQTGKAEQREFAERIASWLVASQLSSGAFPESASSSFVYSRGTGKVFEVLANDLSAHHEALRDSLRWLLEMQMDEENAFFVPEAHLPDTLGGFRHDYFNQELWIDAAGHFLLGGARLLADQAES